MKPTETVRLTAYISECCPQQAIGEFTAEVWHDLLGEYGLAECIAAARKVMTVQPFVAPCEIIAEVKRERRAVLGRIRREQLERDRPPLAICPGDADRNARMLRSDIEAIFAAVPRVTVSSPGLPARADTTAPDEKALEAERRRQLAALEELMRQDGPK